ncbi:MAG: N-acetyltransferase [Oscillospiraceae bacterium]|nr:N-acetyltransferase [Oscillospiraceae bacterium]
MSVRFAREADLPAMLTIYAPYVERTSVSFEYTVPTTEEFTARFRGITKQFPWLVWEEKGEVLGYAYGSAPFERTAFSWCAEASVYLHPSIHRRGIGRKLYAALEVLLRLQGYTLLYAVVTTDNAPSVDFHLSCGYRRLATFPGCGFKLGAWHGIIWLEKTLSSVTSPKQTPAPIGEVVENDQNLADILAKIPLS